MLFRASRVLRAGHSPVPLFQRLHPPAAPSLVDLEPKVVRHLKPVRSIIMRTTWFNDKIETEEILDEEDNVIGEHVWPVGTRQIKSDCFVADHETYRYHQELAKIFDMEMDPKMQVLEPDNFNQRLTFELRRESVNPFRQPPHLEEQQPEVKDVEWCQAARDFGRQDSHLPFDEKAWHVVTHSDGRTVRDPLQRPPAKKEDKPYVRMFKPSPARPSGPTKDKPTDVPLPWNPKKITEEAKAAVQAARVQAKVQRVERDGGPPDEPGVDEALEREMERQLEGGGKKPVAKSGAWKKGMK